MDSTARMPAVYLSHGAPPLADDPIWPGELRAWARDLPRPRAILMVSAHWEDAPVMLGATETVPLVHDFWGFPERYSQVTYPAPGAPDLARAVRGLLPGEVADQPARGLDHGAYVPLKEMFPAADVPVLQISLPTLDPAGLFALGRALAPVRDEGVLPIGSGFFTHNLGLITPQMPGAPAWSQEFDAWGRDALERADVDALLDFAHASPVGTTAHPRTEHFAPLFVTLGMADAAGDLDAATQPIDGFWWGLSKRSVQFG